MNAHIACEALEILWQNYFILSGQIDPATMNPETLASHLQHNKPMRAFRIATWMSRQAFYLAAWSLWEYYAKVLCDSLKKKATKHNGDSNIEWVYQSLLLNDVPFPHHRWFAEANCLRNLIAHHGGKSIGSKATQLFNRSLSSFPDLSTFADSYVAISYSPVADLVTHIEEFIEDTAAIP